MKYYVQDDTIIFDIVYLLFWICPNCLFTKNKPRNKNVWKLLNILSSNISYLKKKKEIYNWNVLLYSTKEKKNSNPEIIYPVKKILNIVKFW